MLKQNLRPLRRMPAQNILRSSILQKGTSFNMLSQEGVNLVFSNLNSYPRESLDGMTPYNKFVAEYGQEGRDFLDSLGIKRIPAALLNSQNPNETKPIS